MPNSQDERGPDKEQQQPQAEPGETTPAADSQATARGDEHPFRLARLLVQDADDLGITLDFTPESLPALDRLLADDRSLLAESPEATRTEDEKWISLKIGCYLGEVIRQSMGGSWMTDRDGNPALSLGEHLVPTVRVVRGLLLEGRVPMPGTAVDTTAEYYQQVDATDRAWLDRFLRGTHRTEGDLVAAMTDDPELASWLLAEARMCMKMARARWNLLLDFSPGSIDTVEDVLGKMHTLLVNGKAGQRPADIQIEAAVKAWGVYVGEVIRRQHGGKWSVSRKDRTVQLTVEGANLSPLGRVRKRLLNGPSNGLPFYFRAVGRVLERQADEGQY